MAASRAWTKSIGIALPLAVLLIAVVARVVTLSCGRTFVEHDEGISFLAASGHEGTFAQLYETQQPPYGAWEPASAWKRLFAVDTPFDFATIEHDLNRNDIHPPLYFWLLNGVVWLAGPSVRAAFVLNAVFDVFSAFLLFFLACRLLGDRSHALTAVALWAVSPAVLMTFAYIRQYSLLGLFAVLLASGCVRVARGDSGRGAAAQVAFGLAGGLLTQYSFAPFALGCVGWTALRARLDRRALGAALGPAAAGGALALAINPGFLGGLSAENTIRQAFTLVTAVGRIGKAADSFVGFFLGTAADRHALDALLATLLLLLLVRRRSQVARCFHALLSYAALRRAAARAMGASSPAAALTFLAAWSSAVVVLPYVLHVVPGHAVGSRYGAIAWPFFACAVVKLASTVRGRLRLEHAVLVVATFGASSWLKHEATHRPDLALPANATAVVVTSTERGQLLPVVWSAPAELPVLAASNNLLTAALLAEHPGAYRIDLTPVQKPRPSLRSLAALVGSRLHRRN